MSTTGLARLLKQAKCLSMAPLVFKTFLKYFTQPKQSSQKKPKIFPRSLFVPLLCAVTFIIIFIIYIPYNSNFTIKLKIIYPLMRITDKSTTIPRYNDSLKRGKPSNTEPILKVCDVPVQKHSVIKVGDHKTYVIGSYVEHRFHPKKIQTVAIVLRSESVDYHCLFCCNGNYISIPAVCNTHTDHFDFEYGTADIVCEVPLTCTTQLYVAVTDSHNSHIKAGFLRNIQPFQLIENQEPQKTFIQRPYNFTVCFSVMFEYENVLQLVQNMEMLKILGVQKVAVYKTNCSSDIQKILDYYVKKDFAEIIPWTVSHYIRVSRGWKKSVSPGELHYFGQIAALNDCVYRYMYQSRYIALQDLDEFILPMKVMTWTELLHQLEKTFGENVGFEFENFLFPISLKQLNSTYAPNLWKNVPGVNILEHITSLENDRTQFNNFKIIVRPELVYSATVHGLLRSVGGTVRVNHDIARMYHVKHVPSEDMEGRKLIEDSHLRDYAKMLIPSVSEVLQQTLNIH